MRRKFLKVFLLVSLFVAFIIWYIYQNFFPLWQFQKLGQFQFPMGTSVETWSDDMLSMNGIFTIDSKQAAAFKTALGLQSQVVNGKEVFLADRCYNDGNNHLVIEFDQVTSLVKIKIEYPDASGDKPCP